jgi:hypothetical protein
LRALKHESEWSPAERFEPHRVSRRPVGLSQTDMV